MTQNIVFDKGEELERKVIIGEVSRPTSVDVTLYNDNTDTLSDTSDVSDLTTEPQGASFARDTISFNDTNFTTGTTGGNWFYEISTSAEFDPSDSTQTVDTGLVIVNYQANGDGSATDHAYFNFDLGATIDLTDFSGNLIEFTDFGISQD